MNLLHATQALHLTNKVMAMHPRNGADLMALNMATQLKYYGSWTDGATLETAVERFKQGMHLGGN